MSEPGIMSEAESFRLCDAAGPIPVFPPVSVDPTTGRILPMTDEERAARRDAAVRAVRANHQITDETDDAERWQEVYRGIDQGRPERKLFEGMY